MIPEITAINFLYLMFVFFIPQLLSIFGYMFAKDKSLIKIISNQNCIKASATIPFYGKYKILPT